MTGLHTLWHRRETWPRDPDGYIFILRTVELIGRALFADEWTGQEPNCTLPHRLPLTRPSAPTPLDLTRAESLLRAVVGRAVATPTILTTARQVQHLPSISLRAALLTDDDWREAIALSEDQWEAALPLVQRFGTVRSEIARLSERGDLVFVSRPKAGGALFQVARQQWNTENLWSRFQYGQFKPSDPFSTSLHTEGTHYLFASLESLQACLEARRPNVQSESSISPRLPVSRYLQTMLVVSERLAITPENQPKKVVVELELSRAWGDDPPLSDRLLKAMATLLRDPESQAGRGRVA